MRSTPSAEAAEQFVTLFDIHYLPQALALYRSLERHAMPFLLWVLCLDDEVEAALVRLALPQMRLVPLREAETDALRAVKAQRSRAEYCWTLTPFVADLVFARAPDAARVTYLDADVFFFAPPAVLLDEFRLSGKDVLITEHGYAPEYAAAARFGRFCVQFVSVKNSAGGRRVMQWWQERCLEWCYAREEAGRFGDQKYLDSWPVAFADEVHVLAQVRRTLAPWNVAWFAQREGRADPVLFHFHGLRLFRTDRVRLFNLHRVGRRNMWIYETYLQAYRAGLADMERSGARRAPLALPAERLYRLRALLRRLRGRLRVVAV